MKLPKTEENKTPFIIYPVFFGEGERRRIKYMDLEEISGLQTPGWVTDLHARKNRKDSYEIIAQGRVKASDLTREEAIESMEEQIYSKK